MIAPVYCTCGTPVTLDGYANDFGKCIVAIQFSLDEGEHWTQYDTPGTTDERLVHWTFTYTPEKPGDYRLLVRSVNEDGKTSPESAAVELHVS